jgi:hypothetical protein
MSIVDHMSREELMRVQASARIYQERADNALQPWNIRAPAPTLGEDVDKYRRTLAVKIKRQLPETHQRFSTVDSMMLRSVFLNRSSTMLSMMRLAIPTLFHPASFAAL